jgi:hypothetical protein
MSRRNVIIAVLALALVIGGAYVSWQQEQRLDEEAELEAELVPEGTLVAIEDCPYGEASCILGQGIERALQRGRVDAVMEFGAPAFFICPGPGRSGAPSPLCDRAGADEGRLGYPIAERGGAASIVEPDALRETLQNFVDAVVFTARDEVGDGILTLYAFSCTDRPLAVQNVSCAREGIILSAIVEHGDGPRREVLIFWARGGFAGRALPFTELWTGAVESNEYDALFGAGGRLDDLGEVHVIDQSLPR